MITLYRILKIVKNDLGTVVGYDILDLEHNTEYTCADIKDLEHMKFDNAEYIGGKYSYIKSNKYKIGL